MLKTKSNNVKIVRFDLLFLFFFLISHLPRTKADLETTKKNSTAQVAISQRHL